MLLFNVLVNNGDVYCVGNWKLEINKDEVLNIFYCDDNGEQILKMTIKKYKMFSCYNVCLSEIYSNSETIIFCDDFEVLFKLFRR